MGKKTLAELQANFATKANDENPNVEWKKFYQFWKMQADQTAIVRFLPDKDEDNGMGFLVENLTHELNINGKRKTVPCLSMFQESCPLCELSRKFYDDKNENMGKKYYRKKSYIGQVLVIESPIDHDQEQLVKLIEFGPKIFKLIQAAFKSGDLENPPYEYRQGYNFRIKKTKSGDFADYSTSSFAPKATDLTDDVVAALELYNLTDYRAKYIDVDTMHAMLSADMTGVAYDRPVSNQAADPQANPSANPPVDPPADPNAPTEPKAPTDTPVKEQPKVVDTPAPNSEPPGTVVHTPVSSPPASNPTEASSSADYLAVIRARAAAKKAAAGA